MNSFFESFRGKVKRFEYSSIRAREGCDDITGNEYFGVLPFERLCVARHNGSAGSRFIDNDEVSFSAGPYANRIADFAFNHKWVAWRALPGIRYGRVTSTGVITQPDNAKGAFTDLGVAEEFDTITAPTADNRRGSKVSIAFTHWGSVAIAIQANTDPDEPTVQVSYFDRNAVEKPSGHWSWQTSPNFILRTVGARDFVGGDVGKFVFMDTGSESTSLIGKITSAASTTVALVDTPGLQSGVISLYTETVFNKTWDGRSAVIFQQALVQNNQPFLPAPLNSNVIVILDVSSSMINNSGVPGVTRFDAAKQSIYVLFNKLQSLGDVRVKVIKFSTDAQEVGPEDEWMTVSVAKEYVAAIELFSGTNFDAPLVMAQNVWADPGKLENAHNIIYFMSDGSPSLPPGSAGVSAGEEATWIAFLNANDIISYALGMGAGALSAGLDPIAYNGVTSTNTGSVVVTDFSEISTSLIATIPVPQVYGSLVVYYLKDEAPTSLFARFQFDNWVNEYTIHSGLRVELDRLISIETDDRNIVTLRALDTQGRDVTMTSPVYDTVIDDYATLTIEQVSGRYYQSVTQADDQSDGSTLEVTLDNGLIYPATLLWRHRPPTIDTEEMVDLQAPEDLTIDGATLTIALTNGSYDLA